MYNKPWVLAFVPSSTVPRLDKTKLELLENRAGTWKTHVLSLALLLAGRMSPPPWHCLLAKLCGALLSLYRKNLDN